MPDYELTGQASQSDIANGSEEADARSSVLINTSLISSSPRQVTENSSGAAPTYNKNGVHMASSTDNDFGSVTCGNNWINFDGFANRTVIIKTTYVSQESAANTADDHYIGYVKADGATLPSIDSDLAIFLPHIGDNTSGNCQVNDGNGDITTGQVDFNTITNLTELVVLIDHSGEFLDAGHTGFYTNGDPRRGDAPDADIAATPTYDRGGGFGLAYESGGGGDGMASNYLEVEFR